MLLSHDILTKFSGRGMDGWRYKIEPNSDFCRDPKEVHLCYLPHDFHTNKHLWISQKQTLLDSDFLTGTLFKCFHCANSSDLLLRVTFKASLGEKKFHRWETWIRGKILNSMLPNSGLFKILIVVVLWMVQDGYFYLPQCPHFLSNRRVVPARPDLFEDPKFCSWPSHYRKNLL